MIPIGGPSQVEFKKYNREIQVYGNLYLATKRLSKNLFNPLNTMIRGSGSTYEIKANEIKVTSTASGAWNYIAIKLDNEKVLGKTLNITTKYNSDCSNPGCYVFSYDSSNAVRQSYNGTNSTSSSGTLQFTSTIPSTLPSGIVGFVLLFYANSNLSKPIGSSTTYTNIMVSTESIPYEPYGGIAFDYTTFPLTEQNEAQILSFNLNQKADVYYTSVPHNTMTLEVNNEKGYFTDYDTDSIIEQLNENCYVELYMKVNSENYQLITTMNFDKISYSDYERAKLDFYSIIAVIEKFDILDRNNNFSENLWRFREYVNFLKNSYNINLISDHPSCTLESTVGVGGIQDYLNYTNLRDMLINVGTHELGQLYGAGVLLTTNYLNALSLKAISNVVNETIESDLQIEKCIVKKEETYKGAKFNWINDEVYQQTSELYNVSLRRTLQSTRDVIIIADNNYKLSDITLNNITASSNVTISLGTVSSYVDKAVSIIVEGNIGDIYDITINKQNIYKKANKQLVTWEMGNTSDISKILEIQDNSPSRGSMCVFLFIKKPIKSYIEMRIMGLPYLEVGDTLQVELENRNIKMFITEIDTTFNEGLIQTIKGYELDWTHQVPTTEYGGTYSDLNSWT